MTVDSHLTAQDEVSQSLSIDPVELPNHLKTARHPPAVTDIFQLLRSAVETTAVELPFAQPTSQTVDMYEV